MSTKKNACLKLSKQLPSKNLSLVWTQFYFFPDRNPRFSANQVASFGPDFSDRTAKAFTVNRIFMVVKF